MRSGQRQDTASWMTSRMSRSHFDVDRSDPLTREPQGRIYSHRCNNWKTNGDQAVIVCTKCARVSELRKRNFFV